MSQLAHPNGLGHGPQPGKAASMALTVLVHVLLALFLVYGINWQTRPREFSDVELYSAPPAVAPPPPVERVEPRPQPRVEPKPEPKPEPKIEPKPEPKPEIALKEKEKPKPEPKPKPVEKKPEPAKEKSQPKVDARERDRELMRMEEELNRESMRVEEQKRQARQRSELERELAGLSESQARAASGKALAAWTDKIRQKVRGNMLLPPGVNGNPEAEFEVALLPDGSLIDVKLRKSSGNKALDEAIERAIRKSDPLPRPDDPGVFQRVLNLKYRPRDE